MQEPSTEPTPACDSPFAAPDGLRFDRATRSWQPFVGDRPSVRRRRAAQDVVLVVSCGGLFVAIFDALSLLGR